MCLRASWQDQCIARSKNVRSEFSWWSRAVVKIHKLILTAVLFLLMGSSTANAWRYTEVREDEQFTRRAEITTRMYAYILQSAVEAFVEHNDGLYPGNLADVNRDGKNVVDYLPGGELLLNQFTFARSEPVDGAAATPGQVGYYVIAHCGENVGYTIDAWGALSDLLTIQHIERYDPCPEPAEAEAPADPAQSNEVDDTDE
jgi:hypothetical protein